MSFTFNGICSDDLHCIVEQFPSPARGERRAEYIVISGRNGAILREDRSFATYTQSYELHIDARGGKLYQYAREIAEWLLGSNGFCRLEDSYDPDVYRMAAFTGPLNLESVLRSNHGRAVIDFTCQPQRYLKSGESSVKVELYDTGSGAVTISPIPSNVAELAVFDYAPEGSDDTTVHVYLRDDNNAVLSEIGMRKAGSINGYVKFTGIGAVVSGATKINVAWLYGEGRSIQINSIDNDDNFRQIFGLDDGRPVLVNPTSFEARPLLRFRDKSSAPDSVAQMLSKVTHTYIYKTGAVTKSAWKAQEGLYTTEPVSVRGYATAIITGCSYSFFDANGDSVKCGFKSMTGERVPIPANAQSIVVGGDAAKDVALLLQETVPNPGTAAATINGTTINLDFSVRDTIYLDCDLHDAYYADGSNANTEVSFADPTTDYPTFPGLSPGENLVIPGDSLNLDFEITPRWWAL